MGSCCSCLCRDPNRDNHLTKFKVTNVDDDGNEVGTGILELTQTELILHTRKREAIRWPYVSLRRYGYDSNLFSFESGRRCQTGQGIFAFKCSRAEEIFNLFQEMIQCNGIRSVKDSSMSHNAHTPEMDKSHKPPTPNTPSNPGQTFPNGFPGFPMRGDSSQPSRVDDPGHSLIGLEKKTHTYVNTVTMEGDHSMCHCMCSRLQVRSSSFPEAARGAMSAGGKQFDKRSKSGVRGFDHGHMARLQQLNYIQVDVEGDPPCQALSSGGAQAQPQHQRLQPKKCGPQAPRRSECYAVIDVEKTVALSNLQKALPRDDGTARKTRHNCPDLPLYRMKRKHEDR